MEIIMKVFHGSKCIIEKPIFGVGNKHNDYGMGFYCTESNELAKEWACPDNESIGYSNAYLLDISELKVLNLCDDSFNILNWMAILLENRTFDTNTEISIRAKQYLLDNFRVDINAADVIIGYRADDSYFSFARDFINNTISVRQLNHAMALGNLGIQVVLKSNTAFEKLKFLNAEPAYPEEYYIKRKARDEQARADYLKGSIRNNTLNDDIFVLDVIRRGLKNGDKII